MSDGLATSIEGQCQYFVIRKKRFCRMTVRPGRSHCGEHDPQLHTEDGQDDSRVPCPYDPKHTCYASKLQKHLRVCNAAPTAAPPYLVPGINAPPPGAPRAPRRLLAHTPHLTLESVLRKVDALYDVHVAGHLAELPPLPIHAVVQPDFAEPSRAEGSRRHLRQASALLALAERRGLVRDGTCYAELGAGKGQLSRYACAAWCATSSDSGVLALDRAALRHKRDARLDACERVRADLAHVALARVPAVRRRAALVALAKHLCGAATDYALRSVTQSSVISKTRGVLLATCCHHRCEPHAYVGAAHLQELGIDSEDLEVMLSVVSWATCGDGRSRDRRRDDASGAKDQDHDSKSEPKDCEETGVDEQICDEESGSKDQHQHCVQKPNAIDMNGDQSAVGNQNSENELSSKVDFLEDQNGYTSVLKHDAKDSSSNAKDRVERIPNRPHKSEVSETQSDSVVNPEQPNNEETEYYDSRRLGLSRADEPSETQSESLVNPEQPNNEETQKYDSRRLGLSRADEPSETQSESLVNPEQPNNEETQYYDSRRLGLTRAEREAVGRRAKALLDHGRVLFLREHGFDAGLCQYVPVHVSPENLCIVATKL